jgi:hypothetical protein
MINFIIFCLSYGLSFILFYFQNIKFESLIVNLEVTSLIISLPLSILFYVIIVSLKERLIDGKIFDIEDENWNNKPTQNKKKSHLRRVK